MTITSQVNGVFLDSSDLYDFYELICQLDVPLFVHPALVPTGYEHLKDYDLPRVSGREVDLTVATTRLLPAAFLTVIRSKDCHSALRRWHCCCQRSARRQRLPLQDPKASLWRILRQELLRYGRCRGRRSSAPLRASGQPSRAPGFCQRLSAGFYRGQHGHRERNGSLRAYVNAVRQLPLNQNQKEATLGGTAAELLKGMTGVV